MGDAGAFAIIVVAFSIAEEGDGKFTLAAVQAVVVAHGWASSRRVRSLIDWLEWAGAAVHHPPRRDSRERPWSFCGWLTPAIEGIARIFLAASARWREEATTHSSPEDQPLVLRTLLTSVSRVMAAPQRVRFSPEMTLFASHAAGLPMLLEIIERAPPEGTSTYSVPFSRKATSRAYRVSRAHVTAIVARVERLEVLKRENNELLLTRAMRSSVLHDLACQLAFVVLMLRKPRPSGRNATGTNGAETG